MTHKLSADFQRDERRGTRKNGRARLLLSQNGSDWRMAIGGC
ncbi:hypothetical protein [Fervidibacter sp.]